MVANLYGSEPAHRCTYNAQVLVILALVYHYGKFPMLRSLTVFGLMAAVVVSLVLGHVSQPQIQAAFAANTLLFMAARVPQVRP